VAETFFTGPEPEKFHNRGGLDMFMERYRNNIGSAKGLVYWKTAGNTKKDWIHTGMDYARFQLALTSLGYKMHPMSQPLQEFPEMDSYRKALDSALSVKPSEKIQMIARLGKSSFAYFSPRRSQKDMLLIPV
ncbi:MAG TPA: nitroreductase family protein, partial [Leptospiraceae bacterium]|nr:nitroreductase family protein [Leptospiraceae bacterium]